MFDEITLGLARELVAQATVGGVTLGCAESCTGGLVSAAITAIPGSSTPMRGGVVSYSPEVKHDILGVGNDIIETPGIGVVSAECARAMAEGARAVLRCDVAVSITGIAGPGGAEPGKPVGTVWFGLATPFSTIASLSCFDGDRDEVRAMAVRRALELLHEGAMEVIDTKIDM